MSPDKRDDQHRIERQIDFGDHRLVGIARQIALGLIDLGAHIGERGLGIEAGLEFEQHIAAAFIGGGAHFLDVADRLELGLDRAQQQPLGILRRDAALGELHIDDRDLDVGLGLFRDRAIGDEARQQQEDQGRDGQPRMADGVVDQFEHWIVPIRLILRSAEGASRRMRAEMKLPRRTHRDFAGTATTFWPSRTKS